LNKLCFHSRCRCTIDEQLPGYGCPDSREGREEHSFNLVLHALLEKIEVHILVSLSERKHRP
jgi:hypothetical protein